MASPKKTNPPAFGEILAGLGGAPEHSSAGRASAAAARSGPAIDVSWIQSARMRASAAQMAQRVAAAAEPKKTGAEDRPRFKLDPTQGWGAAAEPSARPPEPEAGGTAASQSGAPGAAAFTMPGSPPDSVRQPAQAPAGGRSNPVHALWRLLGHIPGGWRVGAGVVASALAAARPARKRAAADPTKLQAPAKPKSEDETIAEELGLRAGLAVVDLRRIRRDFAKKNHPDRFEPAQRLSAARRMTIANMLIDAHMKQRPPSL
jgi:hypothetical protein